MAKDTLAAKQRTSKLSIFPIGAIYMSMSAENPEKYFGGTWEQIAAGRTLVGVSPNESEFNSVGKTGGSKYLQSHNHTGGTSNAGWHTHNQQGYWSQPSGSSTSRYCMATDIISGDPVKSSSLHGSGEHSHSFTTNNTGSGNAQNLQPYLTCYIWQRTA